MKKSTTLTDIATELNMTAATVSRALSDHPEISKSTKEKVREAAKKLNYNPNRIASSLRSGKTNVIGVLIPTAENAFFGSVIHGITKLASKHGYSVLIHECDEDYELEVKGIQTFIGARVDGIIVSLSRNTLKYDHFLEVQKRNTPLVFFDRVPDGPSFPTVVLDAYRGAYLATQHLIDQGYKRIAHIAGPLFIKTFNDRYKGYVAALQANKIPLDHALMHIGDLSIDSGRAATRQFLQLQNPPDAIFATEDFTALGVLKELKVNKIQIPEQFGVLGFCNDVFSEHTTPSISTIDQQTYLMGRESFIMLNNMIENGSVKTSEIVKTVIDPILIVRESSMRSAAEL